VGKNLRPEHLNFFHNRMAEHDRVLSFDPIPSEDDYLYIVHRTNGWPDVTVHLSDAYDYSFAEYVGRPHQLKRNSFVVIALPHAHSVWSAVVDDARDDGIGVGSIRKFMGALNYKDVGTYLTPDERKERENA
jgi:hypothetical protein